MSRALVTVNLELEGEPEQLVNVIERLEISLRAYLEYKVTLHHCRVNTRNTFEGLPNLTPTPGERASRPDIWGPDVPRAIRPLMRMCEHVASNTRCQLANLTAPCRLCVLGDVSKLVHGIPAHKVGGVFAPCRNYLIEALLEMV